MACFHPLKAFARNRNDGSGKKDIVFSMGETAGFTYRDGKLFDQELSIPCGQCIGCRLAYSKEWAIRCVLEAQAYDHNYFLTLTYDDEHLPSPGEAVDPLSGEIVPGVRSSLVPDHLTKFMKDLRRYLEYHFNWIGVRFFACGEYGDTSGRPHFHLILFNCPDLPLSLYKSSETGFLYNCPILDQVWSKGYVVVAEVNFDTCAYVARYITKKHKGRDSDYYKLAGIHPEFTRCSRRPGIAYAYYSDNKERIYDFDEVVITGKDGKPLSVKPARYFDRLYDLDDPEDLARLKAIRKDVAENALLSKLSRTSLSEDQYLNMSEANKLAQIKILKRDKVCGII